MDLLWIAGAAYAIGEGETFDNWFQWLCCCCSGVSHDWLSTIALPVVIRVGARAPIHAYQINLAPFCFTCWILKSTFIPLVYTTTHSFLPFWIALCSDYFMFCSTFLSIALQLIGCIFCVCVFCSFARTVGGTAGILFSAVEFKYWLEKIEKKAELMVFSVFCEKNFWTPKCIFRWEMYVCLSFKNYGKKSKRREVLSYR